MKKNIVWLFFTLVLFVVSGNISANSTLPTSTNSLYSCKDAVGKWSGKGMAKVGFMNCDYSGSGVITHISGDNYNAKIHLDRQSGGFACLAKMDLELNGTCIDNFAILHDSRATLSGMLENGFIHAIGEMTSPKAELEMDIYQE